MNRGTITREKTQIILDLLKNNEEFSNWLDFIRDTEPDYYNFMQDFVSQSVTKINNMVTLSMKDANIIASMILTALSSSYVIYYNTNKEVVDRILKQDSTDKFQQWLDGKLPENYYEYDIKGIKKDSAKYLAKMNHIRLVAEFSSKNRSKEHINEFNKIDENISKNLKTLIMKDEIIL